MKIKKNKKLKKLWLDYKNVTNKNEKIIRRNKLIEEYYNYVQKIAWGLASKLNWNITHDKLTSFGIDGLIQAIEKFDLSKNISFKTYANRRIKGSMIDGIRREDKVPRSVRLKQSNIQKIKHKIEKEKNIQITEDEAVIKSDYDLKDYYKNYNYYNPSSFYSIENLSNTEKEDIKQDMNSILIDKKNKIPEEKIIQKEFFNKLLNSNFTDIERKIILYYYYYNFTMEDISKELNISESRICQIHKNIIPRLKNKIKRNPSFFKDYF